ncbi:hypothetical protein BHE74_00053267, partial [Ensete ventricosum]
WAAARLSFRRQTLKQAASTLFISHPIVADPIAGREGEHIRGLWFVSPSSGRSGSKEVPYQMEFGLGYLIYSLLFLASAAASNITEYDEYWVKREAVARTNILQAYVPEPASVVNHFNTPDIFQ